MTNAMAASLHSALHLASCGLYLFISMQSCRLPISRTQGMHALSKCMLFRIRFSLHALNTFCAHDRLVGLAQRQGPGDVTGVESRDLATKEDVQSQERTKEHSRAHPENTQILEN